MRDWLPTERRNMPAQMRILVVLILLLVPLACGGEDAPDEVAGPETLDEDVAPEAPDVIAETDDGTAFTLEVGADTLLRLSSYYAWDEPFVGGAAVQLDRVDYLQDPGFVEWVVNAVEPGIALITSAGEPQCPQGAEGCPDEPLDFQVRIVVVE
jgi:hypothetical protein